MSYSGQILLLFFSKKKILLITTECERSPLQQYNKKTNHVKKTETKA